MDSNGDGRAATVPTFARAQVRFVLIVLGVYFVGQGIYMALAPGSFFEYVGPYGPRNDHYIRDNASFSVALGVGCLAGVVLPRWQVPVLLVVTIQFWLHTLSHLIDIDGADPEIVGPVEFALLALASVVLTISLVLAARQEARKLSRPS